MKYLSYDVKMVSEPGHVWKDGRMEVKFSEKSKKWRLPGVLYASDVVLCG